MGIVKKPVEYKVDGTVLESLLVYDDSLSDKLATVVVCHAFAGRDAFACGRADELAKMGYAGFALDVYGKGVVGSSFEENRELMKPFLEDRAGLLLRRLRAGLEAAKNQSVVDASKMCAIGYCFGGLCVLDLVRNGASLLGVVSFHGKLGPPPGPPQNRLILTKILVLHGWDDPIVPPDEVTSFATEMDSMRADWQLHAYGRVGHAFTMPEANMPDRGIMYDSTADRRSWEAMKNFLTETFSN